MARDRRMQARMVEGMAIMATPLIILGQDLAEAAVAFEALAEELRLADVMGRIERGEQEGWKPDQSGT